MTGRDCNFLESFFIQSNVRFVIGWEIDDGSRKRADSSSYIEKLERALNNVELKIIGASTAPKFVEPTNKKQDNDSNQTDTESTILKVILHREKQPNKNTWSSALFELVQTIRQEDCVDPIQLLIYGDRFFILNLNHALMDAIAVKMILSEIFKNQTKNDNPLGPISWSLLNWGEVVSDAMTTTKTLEPDYLSLPGSPLTANDILGKDNSLKDYHQNETKSEIEKQDIVISIDAQTAKQCRINARNHSTTWTGLLVACFYRALAEIYGENCCLSTSVLVDLRPYLTKNKNEILRQVQASVTTGRVITKQEVDIEEVDLLVPWLWKVAQEAVKDIRQRIDREEAHRTAVGFATGLGLNEINATVELSNHGVYAATNVEVSQRYDDYTGLSVIAHSSSTDVFKLTASFGNDLDATKVTQFIHRVQELIVLLA